MNNLKVNVYSVLARAVEEGIAYGWQRARKHVENPSEEAIRQAIYEGVMNAICEIFVFDDPKE